jgi:hypothetical protein
MRFSSADGRMSTVASLCGLVTFHSEQPGRGTQLFLAFFILLLRSKSGNYSLSKVSGKNVELKLEEIAEIRKNSGSRTAARRRLARQRRAAGGYGIGYCIGEAKNARFRPEYPTAAVGVTVGAVIGAFTDSKGEVIYQAL